LRMKGGLPRFDTAPRTIDIRKHLLGPAALAPSPARGRPPVARRGGKTGESPSRYDPPEQINEKVYP
jgi:hypothetical protein